MNDWKTIRLSECCSSIADGDHQPPPKADSGVPFITISNFTSTNTLDFSDTMFVPEEYYDTLDEKRKPQSGDIIYSIVGATLGIPIYIHDNKPFAFQRHIGILRCNKTILDPRFLYYVMLSRDFYLMADSVAVGAAQRTIGLAALRNLEIRIPSLNMQTRIASILSAYDDLIETNQRQIKLLEEADQRLYREWFVDLRFPGHEDVPVVDGVPEGWKKERLVDLAEVQYGYAFDGMLFNTDHEGTPIVRIRNIPNGTTEDYTTERADDQYLVENGDIVVGMDGEFHINSWSGQTAYLVQRTCRIRPNVANMNGWLLWAIHEPIKYFEKTVVGATVAHLGKKHIDTITLLTGTEELYAPFQDIFEKRQILLNQNRALSEARDRLLPKLMSGEITI